ncbi:MAG: hypothetical protein FJW66_07340 [Actinobacteria bacterium]|nr:hypothetical protein [Actinomycetota bacterium]
MLLTSIPGPSYAGTITTALATIFTSARWIVILHAVIGEIAVLTYLWIIAELINNQKNSLARIKWVSFGGVVLFFLNWFLSGYYYIVYYERFAEPAIENTSLMWVNSIIMEVKVNIFKFLPILALFVFVLMYSLPEWFSNMKMPRKPVYAICILNVFLGFIMVGFGYLVSATIRANLGK